MPSGGLHLGDLIVDGDDLYGDGVNIAARLEAEAQPGGIVISRAVREGADGRQESHAGLEDRLLATGKPVPTFSRPWKIARRALPAPTRRVSGR